jgi:hypothetical protein
VKIERDFRPHVDNLRVQTATCQSGKNRYLDELRKSLHILLLFSRIVKTGLMSFDLDSVERGKVRQTIGWVP